MGRGIKYSKVKSDLIKLTPTEINLFLLPLQVKSKILNLWQCY